jgi:predicted CopG family antitoxin
MSRQTYSAKPDATERIESLRNDDESFSEFILRVTADSSDVEDGTAVTNRNGSDGQQDAPSDVVTIEELDARLSDLEARLPQRTADELETRFR